MEEFVTGHVDNLYAQLENLTLSSSDSVRGVHVADKIHAHWVPLITKRVIKGSLSGSDGVKISCNSESVSIKEQKEQHAMVWRHLCFECKWLGKKLEQNILLRFI